MTGTPQLALNAGSGVVANYTGGSGTSTLTFTYTVAVGQASSDLDYTSTTALALNGGSIQDAAGNTAVLTLPSIGTDSLATLKIVIDTKGPTVTGVSTTQATGTYGAGTAIPITVTFSGPVTVTGTPQLMLNAGSGALANYTGGSGTSALTFTYTVAAEQNSSDLDYTSTTALALNGGSIQGPVGDVVHTGDVVPAGPFIGDNGTATLSGYVYVDVNDNHVMDSDDWAIANATITLTEVGSSTPLAFVHSNQNGSYSFTGLAKGTYTVAMTTPTNQAGQDNGLSRAILDPNQQLVTLTDTVGPNVYAGISLGDGDTGTNFNFAELTYPAGNAAVLTLPTTGTDSLATQNIVIDTTAPKVTGLSPTSGPTAGGTTVTITGTGFTGATTVNFGTTKATSFTVDSDTQITATSPAGTGVVDVTVVTPGGTSATSSADKFTYITTPLTLIQPQPGPKPVSPVIEGPTQTEVPATAAETKTVRLVPYDTSTTWNGSWGKSSRPPVNTEQAKQPGEATVPLTPAGDARGGSGSSAAQIALLLALGKVTTPPVNTFDAGDLPPEILGLPGRGA